MTGSLNSLSEVLWLATQSCTWGPEPAPEPEVAAPEQKWEYATKAVAGQFIVRFRDYKMAREHKQALANGLGVGHWKYVDRENAAAKFPTDFALVEIDLEHVEELKVGKLLLTCVPMRLVCVTPWCAVGMCSSQDVWWSSRGFRGSSPKMGERGLRWAFAVILWMQASYACKNRGARP